jgi:hypothetical protein
VLAASLLTRECAEALRASQRLSAALLSGVTGLSARSLPGAGASSARSGSGSDSRSPAHAPDS